MESSFQVAVCECPDINASTMAVDITGRFAMVTGRKCMGLIDLVGSHEITEQETETNSLLDSKAISQSSIAANATTLKSAPIARRMVRNSKYEPTASQFSRQIADLFALSTYQTVEVHSINDLNPSKPRLTLKGHSRAVADVDWSHFDPYLLGSSAADCLTNLWDIRDYRRPSSSLTSVSGATQVRFSKTSSNLVATSHEIDVRIWDIRQPSLPLYYIAAHLQKINGMDWSSNQEQLITCGQDNTIKLWDLNVNRIKPSANLQTRTPAWRIRYTPVSPYAILTSTLPQLRSRAECMALKLWSLKSSSYEQKKLELILGLVGHNDVIIDFDWRNKLNSTSDGSCEIVSWSKDQTLRVWRIENQLIEMNVDNSDFETECDTQEQTGQDTVDACLPMVPTDKMNASSPIRSDKHNKSDESHGSPLRQAKPNQDTDGSEADESEGDNVSTTYELKQEFNLINKSIPNIEFEELNYLRRVCMVTARAKSINCRLRIALPPSYPHSECPTFTILDSIQYGAESLNREAKEKLLNLLNETAKSQLSRSRNCLEPCLRKFIAALQKITSSSSYRKRAIGMSSADLKDDPITLSAQRDHSVPFPPTSGARFCGNLLVCFGRPMIPTINTPTGESANWLVETPRSMAQLSAQLDNMRRQGSYNLSNISISYFYYGAMRRAEMQNRLNSKNSTSGANGRTSGSGGMSSGAIVGSRYLSGSRGKSTLSAQTMMSKSYKCGPVIVYDVKTLLGGISKDLAENYVFDKDVIKMCRLNAEIAATYNRRDLVQIWSLAELSSEGALRSYIPMNKEEGVSLINQDSDFGDRPWTMHPFGSKLIQSLIDHYVFNCHDVQTAAMLVWTFSSPKLGRSRHNNFNASSNVQQATRDPKSVTSLFNMFTGQSSVRKQQQKPAVVNNQILDAISDEWSLVNGPETHLYSNSWSNSTNNETQLAELQSSCEQQQQNRTLRTLSGHEDDQFSPASLNEGCASDERYPKSNNLSQERGLQNDLIMHVYAELLYRLNLLNQRAMVLKNIGSNSAYPEIFGDKQSLNDVPEKRLPNLIVQCNNLACRSKCYTVQCHDCKRYSFYCSICRLPVKGSCSICTKCLHGGHVNHFNTWFNNNDFCPTGCGCKCLVNDD